MTTEPAGPEAWEYPCESDDKVGPSTLDGEMWHLAGKSLYIYTFDALVSGGTILSLRSLMGPPKLLF